jgi:hypothetical protein
VLKLIFWQAFLLSPTRGLSHAGVIRCSQILEIHDKSGLPPHLYAVNDVAPRQSKALIASLPRLE